MPQNHNDKIMMVPTSNAVFVLFMKYALIISFHNQARNMTGNGTIIWAIDNFEIRFRQAVNGIEPILQSESAVTGPFGYKFRSLVYLNGDAKAKGNNRTTYCGKSSLHAVRNLQQVC